MAESSFWQRYVKPTLDVLQTIGVCAAGVGFIFTAMQLYDGRRVESANLGLQLDDRFSRPNEVAVIEAAENVPAVPILNDHGGKSSEDDLDLTLGDYDTLYYLHEEKLINDQMLYQLFCFDLQQVHADKEVSAYVTESRRLFDAANIYGGFDRLAATCAQWDKNGKGDALQH